jgi:hypothetical protein
MVPRGIANKKRGIVDQSGSHEHAEINQKRGIVDQSKEGYSRSIWIRSELD